MLNRPVPASPDPDSCNTLPGKEMAFHHAIRPSSKKKNGSGSGHRHAPPECNDASLPWRTVIIDGWCIHIGKNDEQNDELSTQFAQPSDLWLHVAHHAGSHVVIRREKGEPPVPQPVITAAASLAAWFSKAKNSPFTKVHVTEARNVQKRRGAPAGEVLLKTFKTVKIAPRPLEDFDDRGKSV